MKNHLGSYECKLCLTLHNNEVKTFIAFVLPAPPCSIYTASVWSKLLFVHCFDTHKPSGNVDFMLSLYTRICIFICGSACYKLILVHLLLRNAVLAKWWSSFGNNKSNNFPNMQSY